MESCFPVQEVPEARYCGGRVGVHPRKPCQATEGCCKGEYPQDTGDAVTVGCQLRKVAGMEWNWPKIEAVCAVDCKTETARLSKHFGAQITPP